MAKVYDKPITLNTDWGGDASTGNLPVAGGRVQELIKKSFAQKGGFFQIKDKKYLQVFADEKSAKFYNSDADKYADLLISSMQLPNTGATQATMKVTVLATPSEYTTSGRTETFRFLYNSYYEDESDLSAVTGSCLVYINNVQRDRIALRAGNTYTVEVQKYLGSGTNEVKFIIDNAEQSKRTYVYEVQMLNLSVTSDFDSVTAYTGAIPFVYTPIGDGLKTVHVLIDGNEIYTEETEVTNRQQTLDIPAQSHGAHKLEVYLSASVQGIDLESRRLSFAIICVEEGNTTPIIASSLDTIDTTQYDTVTIPFLVYDPQNNPAQITLSIDNIAVSGREVDRTMQSWIYKPTTTGTKTLAIMCNGVRKMFTLNVAESIITSEAETQNLELFLTSQGRSNQDMNKEEWTYKTIAAQFEGMNYQTNGWVVDADGNTAMRLSGGATMTIPLKLFATDLRQTGKTIELEFAVRQINDYESVVLSCLQGGVGLELTPNTIRLTSEQSSMETKYKEDERVRVSFVIEKRANNRLMQIYINGIKSQSLQYPDNDGFTQPSPVGISVNSDTAVVDIYNIRSYNNNLNAQQLLDNYIADLDDIDKKMAIFKRNQVYDIYGNLSYAKLVEQIPVLIITGELSQYKGDKKTVTIEYTDSNHPEKSFTATNVELNVQGTSSQYYPRKNYKGKFKGGFDMTESGKHEDMFTLDESAVLPANAFCFKADFAESSGTHNTGLANYIGWMLNQAKILTEPQKKNGLIRTTVYGEPCLIFHRTTSGSTPQFIGKYNFNTDKSAENTFGFADGDESWEFLNNTSDRSNFLSDDFSGDGWKNDFEGRYPDGNEDISYMKEVFEWVVSCKGDVDKFKSEFTAHFDKDALIFYYLITLVFGMVDQRAKNQFLTWYQGGQWLFIFYDNDTVFGINNEGAIQFSYDVEVHDFIGNLNVFNGANSLLWELVEQAFADDIMKLYQDLRQKGILSYDKVIEYCNTRQSDKWCEAVYNEDGYFKYESPLIDGYVDYSSGSAQTVKTGAFLYALQGSRDAHRRWWLYNRFKYMDSKFQAGSSLSDYITFRTYTPAQWSGVEPNADITVSAFASMYATVRWGSVTKSERMSEGETVTVKAPTDTKFNDTETIIYNASMIKSIGDLSALYVGTVDVSKATNITELIIGSSVAGYQNQNFNVLSLGNNAKLRKLDIQNCPNYTANIDVSGCENIEEVYAKGTGATSVNLAEGGALRVLQLPGTITNITLKNQSILSDTGLTLESWANVVALVIENCPKINAFARVKAILSATNALQRVRITGIKANENDFSILNQLAKLKGIGDNGEYTDVAYVSGTYHVPAASEDEIASLQAVFPFVKITADKIVKAYTITFVVKSQYGNIKDATVTIGSETKSAASGSCSFKLTEGLSYSYTIRYDGGKTSTGSLTVSGDRTISNTFTVTYDVMEMKPEPNGKIQFTVGGSSVSLSLSGNYSNLQVDWGDGTVDSSTQHTYTDGNNFHNVSAAVDNCTSFVVPSSNLYAFWTWGEYTSIAPKSLADYSSLQYIGSDYLVNGANISSLYYYFRYCNSLKEIPQGLFDNCPNVTNFSNCFYNCNILTSIPSDLFDNCPNVTNFSGCFSDCSSLTSIPSGLFDNCTKAERFGSCFSDCSNLKEIPQGLFDNCTKAQYFSSCFNSCSSLTSIPSGLFDNCPNVKDFSGCFSDCSSLKEIPQGLFKNCTKASGFSGAFSRCRISVGYIPFTENLNADYATCYNFCSYLVKVIAKSPTPVARIANAIPSNYSLKIYVPDSAIDTYKTASYWSSFASKIVGFSELTDEEKKEYGIA